MSQRYEREIDELLHRLEGRRRRQPFSRRISHRLRPYTSGLQSAGRAFLRRPPTEQFMIAALALVLVSFLLSLVGLGKWAGYASMLSIAFFVLGIGLSLVGRHSPGYRKTWRGRDVYYPNSLGPSIWVQLRNWLRRRRS